MYECCKDCQTRSVGCRCPEYLKEREKDKAIKEFLKKDKQMDHTIRSIRYNRARKRR